MSPYQMASTEINSLPKWYYFGLVKIEGICRQKVVGILMISVFDIEENIVRKGANAGYKHFLLFPCFQRTSSLVSL